MQQLWSDPATVHGQIFIETPAEDIFAYLATLENLPKWDTWLSQVTFAGDTVQGVYALDVAGLTFPLRFPVTLRLTDLHKPGALTVVFTGMIQGKVQWELTSRARGTLVSARVDYQMSHSVIDSVIGREQAHMTGILSANTAVVEQALANVKMLMAAASGKKQTTVLIVEDNKSIQELLAMFLMAAGKYTIIPAANGAEAIEKVERFQPDLLLLDYHLPDMTGIQLYDYLNARTEHFSLPVLVMSAGLRNNPALSIELEVRRIPGLQKPFHLRELQAAMTQALYPGKG